MFFIEMSIESSSMFQMTFVQISEFYWLPGGDIRCKV